MQLYAKEQNEEVREAVLDALYTQGNGAALVTLARQEKDAHAQARHRPAAVDDDDPVARGEGIPARDPQQVARSHDVVSGRMTVSRMAVRVEPGRPRGGA